MYDDLLSGKAIKIGECCGVYHISVSTFRRYIACLREFLAERRRGEILYHHETQEYLWQKK